MTDGWAIANTRYSIYAVARKKLISLKYGLQHHAICLTAMTMGQSQWTLNNIVNRITNLGNKQRTWISDIKEMFQTTNKCILNTSDSNSRL